MLYLNVIILSIVEGITEFIPVSSTGHLILLEELLPLGEDRQFVWQFMVVIQFPAILAVVTFFWHKLWPFSGDADHRQKTFHLWTKVAAGFMPAAVLGFLLNDFIEARLAWVVPVAIALTVGGLLLILIEGRQLPPRLHSVHDIGFRTAIIIGFFQCLAMLPGTSRSASSIIGAMLVGVSRSAAAEFSFFLAIPTMLGATALTLWRSRMAFSGQQWVLLGLGSAISFLVAYASIAFLMRYIQHHDFKLFGYYRICLAIVVILYFFAFTG